MTDQKLLFIDLETYSSVDIRKSNVYRYSEALDFEILMAAWATEDREVKIAVGEDEIREIPGLFDPSVKKIAHNAQFERICLSRLEGRETGDYQHPETYEDTQALAGVWGYPQSLGMLAIALGGEKKDEAGTRLINLFSKPQVRKGVAKRITASDKPKEWEDFKKYCVQDVVTLVDVYDRLVEKHGGWATDLEYATFINDQLINDRGIQVDLGMADDAVEAADENREIQTARVRELTGVENPGSVVQMMEWFESVNFSMEDLKKATVESALKRATDPVVKEVLELRLDLALVASKKYIAAKENTSDDGRLRGAFKYFGAHTGRWAGRGVQLQNLPSATLDSEAASEAAILDLRMGAGADPYTLKALVRQLFVGPYTVCDYSAIEARVVAWLAGEQWALDAFAAHRDIYIETAARMFHMSYEEATAHRKQGKVAVLALGYNGGVNSLRAMGADGSDAELQALVDQWRKANSNIHRFWEKLEKAFRSGDGRPVGRLRVEKDGRDRHLVLPSGRAIVYHDCRGKWEKDRWGRRVQKITFRDPKKNGFRVDTYGGRLTENATQAVARDVLAAGIQNLEGAGFKVVGHVHDEVLVETGDPDSIAPISDLLTKNPKWADGLPLAAEGYRCRRYRKE